MSTNADNPNLSPDEDVAETVYDSLAPLKNGLRYGLLGLLVLTLLGLLIWWPIAGTPGMWGVLLGAGVGGTFILLTVITIMATATVSPSVTMAMILPFRAFTSWMLLTTFS